MTSIKNKEKVLVKMQDRPDPREAAPGIKAEIEALHVKMVETVCTISYLLSRTLRLPVEHLTYPLMKLASTRLASMVQHMRINLESHFENMEGSAVLQKG